MSDGDQTSTDANIPSAKHIPALPDEDWDPDVVDCHDRGGLGRRPRSVSISPCSSCRRPISVAQVLVVDFGIILKHSGVTIYEIAGGLALAIIIGIPLGIIVATSSLIGRFIYPPIIALQGVPKVAIAPLFAVWMGYGLMPKVILTALIAFFPIVVATILGIRTVPPELISLARSMGLSRSQTLVKISLPHSLPSLFAGLEVALVFAIVGAIVAEFVGASEGTWLPVGILRRPTRRRSDVCRARGPQHDQHRRL